ncbi:MAG: hypothetical protein WCA35_13715 [Kovacikia sp.]
MNQIHPSSVVSPSTGSHNTGLVHASSVPPFSFETVSQTVLKLTDLSLLNPPTDLPPGSSSTIEAMQQLVGIIRTLRSATVPVSTEPPSNAPFSLPFTPENLIPYVSEEAYEVWEALQRESEGKRQQVDGAPGSARTAATRRLPGLSAQHLTRRVLSPLKTQNSKLKTDPVPPSPHFLSIQTLIPALLWSIARSSYLTMQLVEGVRVQRQQADGSWIAGMLRLVTMLTVKTDTVDWCFDLATGRLPESLLDGNVLLRSEDNLLPIWRSPLQVGDQGDRVEPQVQELLKQVQVANPATKAFFQGAPIEFLQPGQDWQTGEMKLKLGFEFTAWEAEFTSYQALFLSPDLVEAELLEDADTAGTSTQGFTPLAPVSQVSVVEMPRQPFRATTLVRLTDSTPLDLCTQAVRQQQVLAAIAYLQQEPLSSDANKPLAQIVNKAYEIVHRTNHTSDSSIHFHQPVLLIEELIPKLLWQVTRSSYEVVQLIGGIEASILQPKACWQQGILRLLATLWFQAPGIDFFIDLATGRWIRPENVFLHPGAVVQSHGSLVSSAAAKFTRFQQPTQIATLLRSIDRQLQAATPEIQLLMGDNQVEWLEDEQEWERGTLQLKLGLEFII